MNHKEACQFLGQKNDQSTSYIYPSQGNYCHKMNPPKRVQITHQAELCLKAEHEQCPIYSQERMEKLPADIVVAHKYKRKKRLSWPILVGILVLFVVSGLFFFGSAFPLGDSETGEKKISEEMAYYTTPTKKNTLPSLTPSRTLTPVPTSTSTPLLSPTITFTPFPTSGSNLTTPFGPDKSYLIHSVRAGESFAYLENEYNTTTEVIMATNVLGNTLQPEMKLVIMPGQASPIDLPKFEVVFLDRDMDLIEIAGMYSASIEDIRYYNSLGLSTETIPAGRWLIIPVEQ